MEPVGVLQMFDPLLQLEQCVFVMNFDCLLVGRKENELLKQLEAEANAIVGHAV